MRRQSNRRERKVIDRGKALSQTRKIRGCSTQTPAPRRRFAVARRII
jgi:hypothetical protein